MTQTRLLGRDELTPTYDDHSTGTSQTKRHARIAGAPFVSVGEVRHGQR